jgi:hypothetical protein
MTPRLVAGLTLVILASNAHARVGETEAQIEKRYGKALETLRSESGVHRKFSFRGFTILVSFQNGISAMEQYQKKDLGVITPTETVQLLDANSNGGKWTDPELSVSGDYIAHTWGSPKLIAIYQPGARSIMIATKQYIYSAGNAIDAAARKKMEGF